MSTPFVLIVGLTLATCVIAYWSDNLGKKLGKKRISILGLRPRQTATILTMASSLGIMMLTLAVLLVFSVSLRNALVHYDQLRADYNQLKSAQKDLQANVASLNAQKERFKVQADASHRQATNAQRDLATTQGHLDQTKKQLGGVQAQLTSAQQARATAEHGRTDAEAARAAARQGEEKAVREQKLAEDLAQQAQGRLVTANQQLAQVRPELVARQKQLGVAKARLATIQANLRTVQANFRTAQSAAKELLKGSRSLTISNAQLQARATTLQSKVRSVQAQLHQLTAQVNELTQQAAALTVAKDDQHNIAAAFATASLNPNFMVNTAFAARVIPTGLNSDQILEMLHALLKEANDVVTRPDMGAQSLHLASMPIQTEIGNGELQEEDILAMLSDYLQRSPVPVSVRVVAARNHLDGERDIFARMAVVPVHQAFGDEEILASTVIDGHQSDASIYNQLLSLVDEGERAAKNRKVLPPLTPDDPYFFAKGTTDSMFAALRRIQALGKPANVRLVSAGDVSTVDPVRVRFEVDA